MSDKVLRCAIYTRKSHEEGLDQAFNSLDAQREAGEDYVRSQRHQGWSVLKRHYDDGGFSGGTMRRPGLEALLEDIGHGDIDVVVVYKVDRLSRSLGDFARIMQLFEKHGVSFVSVTQQFSTTTSMGRLTLNMLLSFAQFEREVTGERIRDKVAATRKKGMWTGGSPPLGYQPVDRQLVLVPTEANLVRRIFDGYQDDASLVALARRLTREGATTKRWRSSKGNWHGGRPLTPKYLYGILDNPLYIGRVVHKDRTWPGQHEAIIDQSTWDRVHATIGKSDAKSRHRWKHPYLLKGKLRTHEGFAVSPGSVHRRTTSGEKRLVRYYVSQKAIRQGYGSCAIKTLNAGRLDELVRALVFDQLEDDLKARLAEREPLVRDHWIREMILAVSLAPDKLTIELDLAQIHVARDHAWPSTGDAAPPAPPPRCMYRPEVERHAKRLSLSLSLQIKRLDGKRVLVCPEGHDLVAPSVPEPNEHIVRALGMAYHCRAALMKTGKTTTQLAFEIGISDSRIKKLLTLTHLSPRIVRDALAGRLPSTATVSRLLAASRRLNWRAQAIELGLRNER